MSMCMNGFYGLKALTGNIPTDMANRAGDFALAPLPGHEPDRTPPQILPAEA